MLTHDFFVELLAITHSVSVSMHIIHNHFRVRQHEKYPLDLRACRFEIYLPLLKSNLPPLFIHCIYFDFPPAHRACKFEISMPTLNIYMPQTVGTTSVLTLHFIVRNAVVSTWNEAVRQT